MNLRITVGISLLISFIFNSLFTFKVHPILQMILTLFSISFIFLYFIRFYFYINHIFLILPVLFTIPFLGENFGWYIYLLLLISSIILAVLDYDFIKFILFFLIFLIVLLIRTLFFFNIKSLFIIIPLACVYIICSILLFFKKKEFRELHNKYENIRSKNSIVEISPFMLEREKFIKEDSEKNMMIFNIVDEAINSLLVTLKILLKSKSVVFFLYNKKNDTLFAEYGISNERMVLKNNVEKNNFLYSVIRDQKNILDNYFIGDIEKLKIYNTTPVIRSIIATPVVKSGESVGALYVDDGDEEKFLPSDVETIKLFADQIGMILNFVEYAQQAKVEATYISILNDITHRLSKTLDFDEVLKTVIDSIKNILTFSNYFLITIKNNKFEIISTDSGLKSLSGEIIPDTFLSSLSVEDSIYFKNNLMSRKIPLRLFSKVENLNFDSMVFIPLYSSAEKRIGLILISHKDLFIDQIKFFILNFISDISKTAIEKSLLYKKTKDLAIKDGLTGIYNHRYFQDELTKILLNASRNKSKVSIGLLDIDYFKKFNDNHGHQTGDLVLKHIAKILEDSVRKTDLVARYGGEEFVIVLTNVKDPHFENIFENIRYKIEDSKIKNENKDELKITVSIGYSLFPDDTTDKNLLINFADKALYKAKELGRNKSVRFRNNL